MSTLQIIVLVFVALLVLYAAVRLSAAAWYRSRREHLVEVARLFKKKKSPSGKSP